jgi:hypothetical protein
MEYAMKVLMISDVYFPRVNGVSTSIQTFRGELAALGHIRRRMPKTRAPCACLRVSYHSIRKIA